MARSRNRPRPGLAWFLLALLGLLLALAARAAAEPSPCPATNLTDIDLDDSADGDDEPDVVDPEEPEEPEEPDVYLDDVPVLGVPDLASPGVAFARRDRRSRWGHLDVTLLWRRTNYEPAHLLPHAADELWLLGTWSQ